VVGTPVAALTTAEMACWNREPGTVMAAGPYTNRASNRVRDPVVVVVRAGGAITGSSGRRRIDHPASSVI
jgi:hypothetical protein